MPQIVSSTLPGINPIVKARAQFTDSDQLDADTTLLVQDLQLGLVSQTPTATRTLTLPSAADMTIQQTALTGLDVSDAVSFIVRNQAVIGSGFNVVVALPLDIAQDAEANLTVAPGTSNEFVLRIDDANPTSPNATIFQVAASSASAGALPTIANLTGAIGATVALTAAAFDLLSNVVLAADVTGVSGVVISGPNANGSSTLTFAQPGNYKVDVTIGGTATIAGLPGSIGVGVGLGAVLPANNLALVSSQAVSPALLSSVTGSAIITVAAPAVDILNLYLSGTAADSLAPSVVHVAVHEA